MEMTMTKRYALIDNSSGFVWWVGDAADPINACELADKEIDAGEALDRTYEETTKFGLATNESGYFVYEVGADFDVDDGQSRKSIAAVDAFPLVAVVRIGSKDEDSTAEAEKAQFAMAIEEYNARS